MNFYEREQISLMSIPIVSTCKNSEYFLVRLINISNNNNNKNKIYLNYQWNHLSRFRCNFHSAYPAQWYLLHPRRGGSMVLANVSDDKIDTCHELDHHSHMLKATLTPRYTSLAVDVRIIQPIMNFATTHNVCNDTIASLLLTHDSFKAIAAGRTCDPFCQAPGTCKLWEATETEDGMVLYSFLCKCKAKYCNDLLLVLQPEFDRENVAICDIAFTPL